MSDTAAALIAAGAVVPGDVEPGDDRDTITARHYSHPALDDRVVVRLVPAVLGVAEDLTCEYLGFDAPTATAEVGTGKRSALGFPAWALVHDPANGHHALNLVKDVERLARTAKSKAGAAKDGFTALGDMLGRSAPHLLPTFYEQAGRIFLEHGNTTYAATMFGKAREAEEVHDLTVDPERIREVFLEFAFAGALTAKALSAHAKGLAKKHDPAEAYELFLTLCVERTRGGLAPYTGMPEDLRRLARAAKRDLAVEDERLLRAVLDTSAIDGANAAFWKSYRDALVRLAQRDDDVRALLLRFVPSSVAALDTWLDILTTSGATRALTEQATGEPGAVSPAAWLSSVCRVRMSGWRSTPRSQRLLELVEAMAERLAADGEPVRVLRGWRQNELDLIDLLLTHGVPVGGDDRGNLSYEVDEWLADEEPGRRDLVALGGAGRHAEALGDGLVGYLRSGARDGIADRDALVSATGVPGLRTALARWLTARAGQARPTGLPGLTERLQELAVAALGEAFADVPEAAEAIAATDVADALHTTLRTGLLDELGWPALEDAVARLREGGKKDEPVVVCGEGWPALVLGRGENFVVVGPDGVLAEHVSRIPPDARHNWSFAPNVSWFDGRLLVRWHSSDGELAYWSDAPSTVFTPAGESRPYYQRDTNRPSIALADGARFGGHRAVRPGDRDVTMGGAAFGDGTTVWTLAYRRDAWRWVEVDPATGEQGRASLPSFVEQFAEDGTELALMVCSLWPAVAATVDSPLGVANGLHGWRVRQQADGGFLGEGVDGRRVRFAKGKPTPTGLLRLPGGGELVLSESYNQVLLLDEHGDRLADVATSIAHPANAAGTPFLAPRGWWHLLRPRDEAGSAALRQVSRSAVEALIAAATEELDRECPDAAARYAALARGERDALATAVTEALPGLSHPALIAGVIDVAVLAATLQRGYRAFGAVAEDARGVDLDALAPSGPVVTDDELNTALSWFSGPRRYHYGSSGTSPATVLPELLTALTEATTQVPAQEQALPVSSHRWYNVLPYLAALAHRAAAPLTPDDQREALVFALRAFAGSGLADDGQAGAGHWRIVTVVVPEDAGVGTDRLLPTPDGFVAVFHKNWHQGDGDLCSGLQYTATAGTFTLPRDWRLSDSTEVAQPFGRDRIARFLDVLAERGPVPWSPDAVPALVELTGLGAAEATVLLAGMPAVDDWGATYLDAAQRKLLGLSAAEAKAAKQRLRVLSDEYRRALLAAAVPEDPAELWTTGPDVAAVAEVWTAAHGVRQPLPDDVLVDAAKQLPFNNTTEFVTSLVNPDTTAWLTEDPDMRFAEAALTARNDRAITAATLRELPGALLWLAQRLPIGSPLRARLPEALELARQRVASPGFAVDLGRWNMAEQVCRLVGADLPPEGTVVDHRPWLHLIGGHHGYCGVVVRPGLVGEEDRPLLAAVAEITGDQWLPVALDTLADDRLAAACAAAAPDGTDPAAAPQDPTVTVPHLVREVAAKLGLDEDPAVLYLQLLALPDPTDANTARWTGWKPARLKAARAALAATDLVLTAKRARAGRSLFLPGGWLALNRPHLPLESWKAPMFGFTDTPTGVVVPREPLADLFARAWQRVLDGDTPAYEELRTGGRR
jgi:hypothetical protein